MENVSTPLLFVRLKVHDHTIDTLAIKVNLAAIRH